MSLSGWVCPVCGEANSPYQNACVAGPHRRMVVSTGTGDWVCTCGSTAQCPVHRPSPNTTTIEMTTARTPEENEG